MSVGADTPARAIAVLGAGPELREAISERLSSPHQQVEHFGLLEPPPRSENADIVVCAAADVVRPFLVSAGAHPPPLDSILNFLQDFKTLVRRLILSFGEEDDARVAVVLPSNFCIDLLLETSLSSGSATERGAALDVQGVLQGLRTLVRGHSPVASLVLLDVPPAEAFSGGGGALLVPSLAPTHDLVPAGEVARALLFALDRSHRPVSVSIDSAWHVFRAVRDRADPRSFDFQRTISRFGSLRSLRPVAVIIGATRNAQTIAAARTLAESGHILALVGGSVAELGDVRSALLESLSTEPHVTLAPCALDDANALRRGVFRAYHEVGDPVALIYNTSARSSRPLMVTSGLTSGRSNRVLHALWRRAALQFRLCG
jgi:hypothetical protein